MDSYFSLLNLSIAQNSYISIFTMFAKQSMQLLIDYPINRNHSAAKISKVMSCIGYPTPICDYAIYGPPFIYSPGHLLNAFLCIFICSPVQLSKWSPHHLDAPHQLQCPVFFLIYFWYFICRVDLSRAHMTGIEQPPLSQSVGRNGWALLTKSSRSDHLRGW